MTSGKWLPHPLATAALLVVWLTLNNTVAFGHILLGALVGWAVPLFTRRLWAGQSRIRRPMIALRLLATVLYDIVVANLAVARLILGPVSALRPAFVRIRLDVREPCAIWTLASIITLTPGTVSSVISEDHLFLLVHVLDLEDETALIADIKQRYETPLKEIFD